ncbi:MAG: L,D-transpeptidase/peptidoglycan binding protein [Eubacterium sp.]|nr:L,D-transpeptidase/peptidoglycan binding protein [Eubacterium sp.]MDD7210472.1 L,D-transpeptidase family protein [Lachnospiraceae bacterium]MDY5497878.1 L,D-transpeptidase family protein [Anaerobutyricum sp.]
MSTKKKAGFTILGLIVLYAIFSVFFQYHYFMGTTVDGYSCGFRSVSKTKELIKEDVKNYKVIIKERQGKKETIESSQIDLEFVDDGKLEKIKKEQKGYAWITALFCPYNYENGITITMNDKKFNEVYNSLSAFDENKVISPVDAYSSYDEETNSYHIVKEVYGNTVKKDKFQPVLKSAVLGLQKLIDIEKEDCYYNPLYKENSKEVIQANKTLNDYVKTDITYDFDDRTEELTGKKIHKWLYESKVHSVEFNKKKVEKYVARLAKKYDTVGIKRHFTSICGNEVNVEGGTYGWKIDQEKETRKLIRLIKKGAVKKREPIYEHVAKSRKKFDIGDTYVEVDLGGQHMWFYKNGKTLVSTDVVTGDISQGRGTPTGVYYILYKTTDYTLTGQGYASPVSYWLPFMQKGVGIHDSSWRSSYGGSIFTYDGSHGCVNTPKSAVAKIYENIESTYPVVVHW